MTDSTDRFTRHDYSISMAKANIYSIVIAIPVVILLVSLYCVLWGGEQTLTQFTSVFQNPARMVITDLIFLDDVRCWGGRA